KKNKMKTKTFSIITLSAGLFLTACTNSQQNKEGAESKELSGTIKVDGSSTVYPLTEAVAEEYRTMQPKVRVSIGSSGSGAGFKKFARGETDISDASRAIKDKEVNACKENNINYLEIRVALDGIAIVVNKENTWLETITTEELKQLWQPNSTINNWSDIQDDWPDEKINLFGPSTAHGTYDFFTEEITGESGASRSDYNAVSDYNVAVQGISTDKNALGYFGLAYYTENKDKLKLISVDNGNGAVFPSLETVGNGTYSPLSRPLYIYVNTKSAKRQEVAEFVNFYLDNAGELAKDVGYIPLSTLEYNKSKKELNAL
ncbi:MAG: PstS family phosphate ABC transporter substrate-binding protein, partial [Fidelibacterota bacterium]